MAMYQPTEKKQVMNQELLRQHGPKAAKLHHNKGSTVEQIIYIV